MSNPDLAHEPRPPAFSKAKEVAKHLGDEWKAVDRESTYLASIDGPGLRSLTLNMGTWRNGRLTILGSIHRLEKFYRDERVERPWASDPMPQISVDPNKDGETIAKDIKRRLSDDYEKTYALMAEKFERMKRVTAERERTVEALRQMTGAHQKEHRNFPFEVNTKMVILQVDAPDMIRFNHAFSLDQMKRLIIAIPELFK